VPYKNFSGDYFYCLLAKALDDMGHDVTFIAPEGSYCPPNGKLMPMMCSYSLFNPSAYECEADAFYKYKDFLKTQDMIHDFSLEKTICNKMIEIGYKNVIPNILGAPWHEKIPNINVITPSKSMLDRGLRGASDYENTPTPNFDGNIKQFAIKSGKFVHLGIDTQYYYPTYNKKDHFLWFGRWHHTRGFLKAIEFAKTTGINLIMAGRAPENEMFEYQKNCALEALEAAKNCSNIEFHFLPEGDAHHEYKRKLFQEAKAALNTVQFQEPFGLSQIEIMSCGTPIIANNYGSTPEIIEDKINGVVVENSIESWIKALDPINKIDYKTCREIAVKKFDYKVMAQNYIKEYREIMKGNSW
jgi:glycosyltransferase involved in cell wall biosynthesis